MRLPTCTSTRRWGYMSEEAPCSQLKVATGGKLGKLSMYRILNKHRLVAGQLDFRGVGDIRTTGRRPLRSSTTIEARRTCSGRQYSRQGTTWHHAT